MTQVENNDISISKNYIYYLLKILWTREACNPLDSLLIRLWIINVISILHICLLLLFLLYKKKITNYFCNYKNYFSKHLGGFKMVRDC